MTQPQDDLIRQEPIRVLEALLFASAEPLSLTALRGRLRQRLQSSPLMDARGFTRDLEGAYREAWRRFCAPRERA